MSQEQPQREQQEALKYGDVFNVNGELAEQPIAPQDAAMMQSAEAMVFGQTQKGGPASVMQAAAAKNERSGVVSHEDTTQVAGDEGVTVAETQVPGRRIVTESVAGQVCNFTDFIFLFLFFTNTFLLRRSYFVWL